MEERIAQKTTSVGLVEVKKCGTDYRLYVNGSMKQWNSDPGYIMCKYDKLG